MKLGLQKSALKLGLCISNSTKFGFSIHSKLGLWDFTLFEIGITGLQDPPYGGPSRGFDCLNMESFGIHFEPQPSCSMDTFQVPSSLLIILITHVIWIHIVCELLVAFVLYLFNQMTVVHNICYGIEGPIKACMLPGVDEIHALYENGAILNDLPSTRMQESVNVLDVVLPCSVALNYKLPTS